MRSPPNPGGGYQTHKPSQTRTNPPWRHTGRSAGRPNKADHHGRETPDSDALFASAFDCAFRSDTHGDVGRYSNLRRLNPAYFGEASFASDHSQLGGNSHRHRNL